MCLCIAHCNSNIEFVVGLPLHEFIFRFDLHAVTVELAGCLHEQTACPKLEHSEIAGTIHLKTKLHSPDSLTEIERNYSIS